MRSLVACREAGSPASCPPLQNRLGHRLLEFIDVCQVQVRIGCQQNLFLRSATWHTDFYPRRFRRFHQAHRAVSVVRPSRIQSVFRKNVKNATHAPTSTKIFFFCKYSMHSSALALRESNKKMRPPFSSPISFIFMMRT